MNEKMIVLFLTKIMAEQYATNDFLANAFSNGSVAKKSEILAHMKSSSQLYQKTMLPELLKLANLDWDPNDLFS